MILYITSFAEDMYSISGSKLIKSFIKTEQKGNLLICNEGFDIDIKQDNIISYRLDTSQILINWLEDNKKYIPEYLGGTANEKELPIAFTGANRKASRWFRKVVSIHYAYTMYKDEYDYMIWVDCDCVFKKQISISMIENLFSNNIGCFYYLGKKRFLEDKGIESGFIGFYKQNNGFDIITTIIDIYLTQEYIKYVRWDDGYIFRVAIAKNQHIICNDLAKNSMEIDVINEINNYFSQYIKHNKGLHRLKKILI